MKTEKSDNETEEFHVFVTSNASRTHIIAGENERTLCGIENEPIEKVGCRFPCSEIRDSYDASGFKKWVDEQRVQLGELGFCSKCLKTYDKWYSTNQQKL